jgi:hypothetical protein
LPNELRITPRQLVVAPAGAAASKTSKKKKKQAPIVVESEPNALTALTVRYSSQRQWTSFLH